MVRSSIIAVIVTVTASRTRLALILPGRAERKSAARELFTAPAHQDARPVIGCQFSVVSSARQPDWQPAITCAAAV
jgi:hypothetical protein